MERWDREPCCLCRLRRTVAPSLLVVTLGLAGGAPTQALHLPVEEYVLENGLKLLVLPRHEVPQVACRITFRVGSVNERAGTTGLSHFLEHMMFKGTSRIGVKDMARDRELMTQLDAIVDQIKALRSRLSVADLTACRTYLGNPVGSHPKGWETYRKVRAASERMEALRTKQDKNLVSEELWNLYQRAGGTDLNAETGHDWTGYRVKLPAGMEELFFWLEADRMENAVFRQFYPEKEVILDERNQTTEGTPAGRFFERLTGVFHEAHPYRYPIVGYEADIRRITREDLYRHYRTYYRPNNAIVTIVGDVDPASVRQLADRYFGGMAPGPPVQLPDTCEGGDLGVKRLEAEAHAADQVVIFFHTPPEGHPDSLSLDVAAGVLTGASGRLNRRLVLGEKVAVLVVAWNYTRTYAGEFGLYAVAAPGADLKTIEELLLEEIENLRRTPPSDEELARGKLTIEARFVRRLETLTGTASLLAGAEAVTSWRDLVTYIPRLQAVTPEKVVDAVTMYLGDVRTVGVLRRKEAPGTASAHGAGHK